MVTARAIRISHLRCVYGGKLATPNRGFQTAIDGVEPCHALPLLRLRSQGNYLCADVAVRSNGVHGEAKFSTQGKPACRRGDMPGDSIMLEGAGGVPMADQHVPHT